MLCAAGWLAQSAQAADYYLLQGVDKTKSDALVSSPNLDGFSIRVSWRKLHEEGFAWLDQQIARGQQLNRKIQLRVMAGSGAPGNLPQVGYFNYKQSNQYRDNTGATERVPIPWDPDLHRHWNNLVSQLGNRYGNNRRIRVMHVPSFGNSSEMHTPDAVKSVPGYTSRKLANSWLAMAEPLVGAFPRSTISLNFATPSQAKITATDCGWLLDEMVNVAGSRAGFQANDLSGKTSLTRNKYAILVDLDEQGHSVGFQMLGNSSAGRFKGSFQDALDIGNRAGAEWFEIYEGDLRSLPPKVAAAEDDLNFEGQVDHDD
jgi:hypothetical protein